jgi:hypothetical protein
MCQDCERLHEQLQQQSYEMYQLRCKIRRLRSELKKERVEKAKLLKDSTKNTKIRPRKGQKRSRFGRI